MSDMHALPQGSACIIHCFNVATERSILDPPRRIHSLSPTPDRRILMTGLQPHTLGIRVIRPWSPSHERPASFPAT